MQMETINISQIKKVLADSNCDQYQMLNIKILRNVMLEPIEQYYKYFAYLHFLNARIQFGEYDQMLQDINSEESILNGSIDCVIVFYQLDTASNLLSSRFISMSNTDLTNEIKRIQIFISNIVFGIRQKTNAMILWHGFELPVYTAKGIMDDQVGNNMHSIVSKLNSFIKDELDSYSSAYYVDMNRCLARLGYEKFYDLRYWQIGKAPYSRYAYQEIAQENMKYVRALNGKNKKCLVLDCDNTLWHGVIGEDGLEGIVISKDYPGSIYYNLQKEVLNLYDQGIFITVCSKNNEADVLNVFHNHPDMLLREEHISVFQINWNDKASNIVRISELLNIGLDSILFIDDSEFEINLVKNKLPEVETLFFNGDARLKIKELLFGRGFFDSLTLSNEDKKRTEMYQSEKKRERFKKKSIDISTYLKSLEMEITISLVSKLQIARVSQLTQKTNQFNLTTKRYTEADIENFMNNGDFVFYLSLNDKFGDYGVTGVCIVTFDEGTATIDSLILSCRILGRNVEYIFLHKILDYLKKLGHNKIKAQYRKTSKNEQVNDFYPQLSFNLVSHIEKEFNYLLETVVCTNSNSNSNSKTNLFNKINFYIEVNSG
jgi:FkbH-like protein